MEDVKFLGHSFEVCKEEVSDMAVDISKAKKIAKELYETVNNVKQSMITGNIATDLDQIIKNLNLRIFEIDMDEFSKKVEDINFDSETSGFLIEVDNQHVIYLNKKDSMNRKRFTIAHEIGHLKLNHLGVRMRDSTTSQGTDENEVLANAFAAELLMPEELVEWVYPMVNSVSRVAQVFGVSEIAAYNRLKNLGIINNEW